MKNWSLSRQNWLLRTFPTPVTSEKEISKQRNVSMPTDNNRLDLSSKGLCIQQWVHTWILKKKKNSQNYQKHSAAECCGTQILWLVICIKSEAVDNVNPKPNRDRRSQKVFFWWNLILILISWLRWGFQNGAKTNAHYELRANARHKMGTHHCICTIYHQRHR